jgi:hypothetical protein
MTLVLTEASTTGRIVCYPYVCRHERWIALLRRWEGPPREWWIALNGAIALALIPKVPLAPFFGVTAHWVRWFAESVLGGAITITTHDGSLVAFLPVIGAATLAIPFLFLVAQARWRLKTAAWSAGTFAALLVLLAGIEIAESLLAADAWWNIGRIALTCAAGLSIAALGIGLRRAEAEPRSLIPALSVALLSSGLCIASFVLLPVGLLGLLGAYVLLTVVLLRGEHLETPLI